MMPLWIAMVALSLFAAAFVLWPLWRYRSQLSQHSAVVAQEAQINIDANIALFHEHMADLDLALAEGRIDQQQHAQLKLEQERALLEDELVIKASQTKISTAVQTYILVVAAALTVALGIMVYFQLGSSRDAHIQQLQAEKIELDYQDLLSQRNPDPERARQLVKEIEQRVQQEPDHLQYWFLLARHQMELSEYDKAVNAYQRALSLDPGAGILMAELAQVMFLRNQNRMTAEIADLAQKALIAAPQNTTALGLAGIHAFQQKDFRAAVKYWQQAVDVLGVDAPASLALQSGIARAKQESANAGQPIASDSESATGPRINLSIRLGDSVSASPDQLVYVYARAWQGARMPLAITRIKVSDLPANVTLDESLSMSGMASLSQADQVEVVARISQDGSAVSKAGDWQVSAGPLDMHALPEETVLVIEQQLSE